jgi:hypothetical protein
MTYVIFLSELLRAGFKPPLGFHPDQGVTKGTSKFPLA